MKKQHKQLGSAYDDGNAIGLGELGQAGMSPLWGAVVGGGLSTVGSVVSRQIGAKMMKPTFTNWAEGIGFALGAAGSGAMILMGDSNTKEAGWIGLASAFLNSGLRQVERLLFPGTAGLQGAVIDRTQVLRGARGGLGLVDIQPTQALMGARNSGAPQLVGASLAQASRHIQLVGGPALDEHSASWGATHFNH